MSEARFREEVEQSLVAGTFRHLTLARPAGEEARRNVYFRPVLVQGKSLVQLTHRHPTRDVTENLAAADAIRRVQNWLGTAFLDAHLETENAALSLRFGKRGEARFSRKKLVAESEIHLGNDRQKTRLLDPAVLPWVADLGLTDAGGRIHASRSAKWRQVERFVELLSHAWRDVRWEEGRNESDGHEDHRQAPRPLQVYDMGCGKGYLTFAVEAWFTDVARVDAQVHGVEQRPELVDLCNQLARKHQRTDLIFENGQIGQAAFTHLDVLIALHACDTATDDALALGIRHRAQMIVCAPCCQHELRETMTGSDTTAGLLAHGLFRQRQAALLTDALRTLLLEREGYTVRVVEFVTAEHTDKNLLLIATRTGRPSISAQARINELKALFGLPTLYLETLLA